MPEIAPRRIPTTSRAARVDSFEVPNHIHLMLSTNKPRAVFAQHDERRYAVFNVSSIHKEDTAYFSKLWNWFEGPGASALLHYLQNYDYGAIDLRIAPRTAALAAQKIECLDLIDRVIYQGLLNEEMLPNRPWSEAISRERFVKHVNDNRRRWETLVSVDQVGRRLASRFPGRTNHRKHGTVRERSWRMPELAEARRDFEKFLGQPLDWSDPTSDSRSVVKFPVQQSN
jgi:hypothetical protein